MFDGVLIAKDVLSIKSCSSFVSVLFMPAIFSASFIFIASFVSIDVQPAIIITETKSRIRQVFLTV